MPKTNKGQDELGMHLNYRLYDLMREYGIGSSRSDWPSNRLRKWLKIGGEKFSKYITFELPLDMIAKMKCFLAFRDKAFAPADKIEMGLLERFKNEIIVLPFLPKNLMGPIKNFLPEIRENDPVKVKKTKSTKQDKGKDDDKFQLNRVLKGLVEKHEIGSGGMSVTDFCRWLGVQQSSYNDYLRLKYAVSEVNRIRFYLAFRQEVFAPSTMKELQYLEELKDKIDPLPFLSKEDSGPIDMSQFDHLRESINNEKFKLNNILVDLIRQYSIGMPGSMSISEFCDLVNIHSTAFQDMVRYRTSISSLYKSRLYLAFRHEGFAPTNRKELVIIRHLNGRIKPLPFLSEKLREPLDFSKFDIKEEPVDENYKLNAVLVRNLENHGIGILPEKSLTGFCKGLSMGPSSAHGFVANRYSLGTTKSRLAKIKFYLAFRDPAFAPQNAEEKEILRKWKDKIKPLPLIPLPIIEAGQEAIKADVKPVVPKEPEKVSDAKTEKSAKQEDDKYKLNKIFKQLVDEYTANHPGMYRKDYVAYLGIPNTSLSEYFNCHRFILKPEHKIAIYLAFEHEAFAPSTDEEQKVWQQMKDTIVPLSQKDVVHPDKEKKQAKPEPQAVEPKKEDKAEDEFALNRVLIQLMDQYKIGKGGPSKKQTLRKLKMHGQTFDRYVKMEHPLRLTNKIKLYLGFRHEAFVPSNDEEREIYNKLKDQIYPLSFIKKQDRAAQMEIEEVGSPTETVAADLNVSDLSQQVAARLVSDPGFAAKMCEIMLGSSGFIANIAKQLPGGVRQKQVAAGKQTLPLAMPVAVEKEPDGKTIPAKFVAETRQILNQAIRRLQELRIMDNRQRNDIQDELEVAFRSLENELKDLWLNVRAVRKTRSAQAAQQVYETERAFVDTFKNGK